MIDTIEQQLGIPGLFTKGLHAKYGSWWAARKLLQVVWQKKPQVIRDASFDLRDKPFYGAAESITWRRDLEPYMIGWTVHHFDKNSQWLSANRGMYTGIGDPVHVADGDDGTFIEPKLPGIYRVMVKTGFSEFDGKIYPHIIEPEQEWVTKDVLLFARKNGYDVAWATNPKTHPGLDLIHPNWWADTVGAARVKLLANLLTYGTSPVLIETDGIFYITRDPEPRTAICSVGEGVSIMAREKESGGYKHKPRSFVLTEALYEQARDMDAGDLADLFKEAAK